MSITWKGKAGEIADTIAKMTVKRSGGGALFSPMAMTVDTKAKRIDFAWVTIDHTAAVWGHVDGLDVKGASGQYVVNAELADWLTKVFGAEESVTLTHNGTEVLLAGEKFEARFVPTDFDASGVDAAKHVKVEKDMPAMKDVKWKEATVKVEELKAILSPTTLVYGSSDVKTLGLFFSPTECRAQIGSLESHANKINRKLDAKSKTEFNVMFGQNLAEVLDVIEGSVKLFVVTSEQPAWLLSKTEKMTLGYLLAPYAPEANESGEEEKPKEKAGAKAKKEEEDEEAIEVDDEK